MRWDVGILLSVHSNRDLSQPEFRRAPVGRSEPMTTSCLAPWPGWSLSSRPSRLT